MVIVLHLKIRSCDDCGHEAVAIGGVGTECIECDTGEYVEWTGNVKEVELASVDNDDWKKHPEVVTWREY